MIFTLSQELKYLFNLLAALNNEDYNKNQVIY
jgi:hypothetical protein